MTKRKIDESDFNKNEDPINVNESQDVSSENSNQSHSKEEKIKSFQEYYTEASDCYDDKNYQKAYEIIEEIEKYYKPELDINPSLNLLCGFIFAHLGYTENDPEENYCASVTGFQRAFRLNENFENDFNLCEKIVNTLLNFEIKNYELFDIVTSDIRKYSEYLLAKNMSSKDELMSLCKKIGSRWHIKAISYYQKEIKQDMMLEAMFLEAEFYYKKFIELSDIVPLGYDEIIKNLSNIRENNIGSILSLIQNNPQEKTKAIYEELYNYAKNLLNDNRFKEIAFKALYLEYPNTLIIFKEYALILEEQDKNSLRELCINNLSNPNLEIREIASNRLGECYAENISLAKQKGEIFSLKTLCIANILSNKLLSNEPSMLKDETQNNIIQTSVDACIMQSNNELNSFASRIEPRSINNQQNIGR